VRTSSATTSDFFFGSATARSFAVASSCCHPRKLPPTSIACPPWPATPQRYGGRPVAAALPFGVDRVARRRSSNSSPTDGAAGPADLAVGASSLSSASRTITDLADRGEGEGERILSSQPSADIRITKTAGLQPSADIRTGLPFRHLANPSNDIHRHTDHLERSNPSLAGSPRRVLSAPASWQGIESPVDAGASTAAPIVGDASTRRLAASTDLPQSASSPALPTPTGGPA
jgi:hypothetical protein